MVRFLSLFFALLPAVAVSEAPEGQKLFRLHCAACHGAEARGDGPMGEVLAGGEPLVLYPEGERKDGPVVQPLFDGAAFVAARAGVPIVPVGIIGSRNIVPPGTIKIKRHQTVTVRIGTPITDTAGRPVTDLRDETHQAVADLIS